MLRNWGQTVKKDAHIYCDTKKMCTFAVHFGREAEGKAKFFNN